MPVVSRPEIACGSGRGRARKRQAANVSPRVEGEVALQGGSPVRSSLGWRIAGAATVLVAAMVLDQPGAHAGIDASGAWRISEFGMGFIEGWQQTGSSLGTPGFSGTIDSATGAFSLTGDSPTCPVASDTITGTVAPDGLTLTGTLTFHGTFDCCFSMACGSSVFGSRCGNGVLGPGEQCDAGLPTGTTGDCCTAACQFQPGGTACADSTKLCARGGVCDGAGGGPPPPP